MMVISSGEEGFTRKHLSEDAAYGPDVNGLCVLFEGKHDLGCSVPTGGDVFGHESCFCARGFGRFHTACETKVAHFQITVGVEEEIGGFQVSMNDVC